MQPLAQRPTLSLSLRTRVFATQILAYMLDSLVRVSRRVNENRIVSIANPLSGAQHRPRTCTRRRLFSAHRAQHAPPNRTECRLFIPQSPTAGRARPLVTDRPRLLPRQELMLTPTASEQTPLVQRRPGEAARMASSASLLTISSTIHSLFKVLFIFPSRYLFAIGLSPIFSFR